MTCRLFNELTGPVARSIAKDMGVYENSPLGMPLVELAIHDGVIEVRAHAQESFTSLAMRVNRQSDITSIIYTVTDRETGVEMITEREASGRITACQLDPSADTLLPLTPAHPRADEVRLREMSHKVIRKLLETDIAKFS